MKYNGILLRIGENARACGDKIEIVCYLKHENLIRLKVFDLTLKPYLLYYLLFFDFHLI